MGDNYDPSKGPTTGQRISNAISGAFNGAVMGAQVQEKLLDLQYRQAQLKQQRAHTFNEMTQRKYNVAKDMLDLSFKMQGDTRSRFLQKNGGLINDGLFPATMNEDGTVTPSQHQLDFSFTLGADEAAQQMKLWEMGADPMTTMPVGGEANSGAPATVPNPTGGVTPVSALPGGGGTQPTGTSAGAGGEKTSLIPAAPFNPREALVKMGWDATSPALTEEVNKREQTRQDNIDFAHQRYLNLDGSNMQPSTFRKAISEKGLVPVPVGKDQVQLQAIGAHPGAAENQWVKTYQDLLTKWYESKRGTKLPPGAIEQAQYKLKQFVAAGMVTGGQMADNQTAFRTLNQMIDRSTMDAEAGKGTNVPGAAVPGMTSAPATSAAPAVGGAPTPGNSSLAPQGIGTSGKPSSQGEVQQPLSDEQLMRPTGEFTPEEHRQLSDSGRAVQAAMDGAEQFFQALAENPKSIGDIGGMLSQEKALRGRGGFFDLDNLRGWAAKKYGGGPNPPVVQKFIDYMPLAQLALQKPLLPGSMSDFETKYTTRLSLTSTQGKEAVGTVMAHVTFLKEKIDSELEAARARNIPEQELAVLAANRTRLEKVTNTMNHMAKVLGPNTARLPNVTIQNLAADLGPELQKWESSLKAAKMSGPAAPGALDLLPQDVRIIVRALMQQPIQWNQLIAEIYKEPTPASSKAPNTSGKP